MLDLTDLIIESLQRQTDWQSSLRLQQPIGAYDTDDLEIA
jgi:hypothetical protein